MLGRSQSKRLPTASSSTSTAKRPQMTRRRRERTCASAVSPGSKLDAAVRARRSVERHFASIEPSASMLHRH